MSRTVVLDAGPLGLLTAPPGVQSKACSEWIADLLTANDHIILPEIADYEVRRELLRMQKAKSLARLDALATIVEYLPVTTSAMRRAAELWAQARQQGKPTAGQKAIDADAILAAQALTLSGDNIVVATTNIRHLSRFVVAELWQDITP